MLTFARSLSRSSASFNSKRLSISLKNIEVFKDSQEREHDIYWNTHGSRQTNLKKSDLRKPKDSWGQDHHEAYTFLKDSDTLISRNSHTVFRPLNSRISSSSSEEMVFMGNFWVSPDAPKKSVEKIVSKQCYDVRFAVGNSMMCADRNTLKWYQKMSGSGDFVLKNYVSYYDIGDLRIPEKLDDSGITLKNSKEASDADILNYDAKVFNYERSKYVLNHLREDIGRVAYNHNGDVIGFGAISIFPSGEVAVSPMYADEMRVAQTILKSILEEMTLDAKRFWRLKVMTNDAFPESYGWIRPFVTTMTHRNESSVLMCDHKLEGVDFKKVYSSFPRNICPI